MEQVSINPEITGSMAPGQEMPGAAPTQQTQETQETTERPAWLPEGFDSPEALAKAYSELQSSQQNKTEEQPMSAEEVAVDEKLGKFSSEFFEKGSLSPDSYKELSKMGYPRSVVDQFIEGQKARMSIEETQILSEIGGKDEYTAMTQWAGKNMKQTEIEAYNRAVESGDLDSAMFAVKGLQARYKAASGAAEPRFVQGGKTAPGGYDSVAQVVAAMSDKRYSTDPAYRAEVERKIGNSTVL
jgi:hypothetical protein